MKFPATPAQYRRPPPPPLGEHTDEVAATKPGWPAEEIAAPRRPACCEPAVTFATPRKRKSRRALWRLRPSCPKLAATLMDMSDIEGRPGSAGSAAPFPPAPCADDGKTAQRWHRLVAEIGAATATPLTSALERIHTLITSGKIDRARPCALRDEVESARQAGMTGQQIARFASGRLRQSHERLQLADTLEACWRTATARRSRAASCSAGAEGRRGHRRRLAAVQPAQHRARLGARARAVEYRVRDRHQILAAERAAHLPLRAPPRRPGGRERAGARARGAGSR